MSRETLHLLKNCAGKVERGEDLTPSERVVAFFGMVDMSDRVRRARAAGLEVRLSPHMENLCRAVGGS